MSKIKLAVTTLAIVLVVGCATAQAPQLTPLEIQSLQTREYEETKEIVFPSVLSVFQDLGYIIKTADKDTGFITAEGLAKEEFSGLGESFLIGLFDDWEHNLGGSGVRSTGVQVYATAFTEKIGKRTRVRLNLVKRVSSSSAYGQNSKNDTPILDAQIYRNAFEKIENAIFIRSSN